MSDELIFDETDDPEFPERIAVRMTENKVSISYEYKMAGEWKSWQDMGASLTIEQFKQVIEWFRPINRERARAKIRRLKAEQHASGRKE